MTKNKLSVKGKGKPTKSIESKKAIIIYYYKKPSIIHIR